MASREANLKYRYGMTLVDYNEMLVSQDSRCKICDVESSGLVVDHCHNSGEIRGLLCPNCNKGLGLFKDSPERMERAAQYLIETKSETPSSISPTSISGGYAEDQSRAA